MEADRPFGALLREFRLAAGLSQEALAERARLSSAGISVLERGARRAPHRDTVALLATGLELTAADRARLEAAAVQPRASRPNGSSCDVADGRPTHNLPFALTSFIGRERETSSLRKNLLEHRLVTVCGIGGIGKTRLVIETARDIVARFPDGVWLVELAPLSDPAQVAARVASALGVPQRLDATADAWIGEFSEKRLLLVLDNCEHVLAACALVAQSLLQRCSNLRILATSREPLRIGGERVVRLDSLDLPLLREDRLPNLDELRGSAAIRMFFDRARDVAPHFSIGDGEGSTLRALHGVCIRLDAMPFAIELAAAHMNAMSVETLQSALDRRFHLLARGARTALPRHQTLRALLDWSYDLLSDLEQRIVRRLGVFAGGWTLAAAEAVCAAGVARESVLAILSALVDKSLVVADTSSAGSRYDMLESTRAYALERLIENGEYSDAIHAHAEYFRDYLVTANARYGRPSVPAWLEPVKVELDNVRAALQRALVDRHDIALGAALVAETYALVQTLSLFAEINRWCSLALEMLGPAIDPALEMPLQYMLAATYNTGGYAARAIAPAVRAVELCRTLGGDARVGHVGAAAAMAGALSFAAFSLAILGRNDEADPFATEAVAVAYAERGWGLPWALFVKSLTVPYDAMTERRALVNKALALSDADSDAAFGWALIAASQTEFDGGDFELAQAYGREAAAYYRRYGVFGNLAIWALSLAAVAGFVGDDVEAAYADALDALMNVYRVSRALSSGALQVVASGAAQRGYARAAAHLMGAADAVFAELERPRLRSVQFLYDRTLLQLRANVTDAELSTWMKNGATWSFEHSVEIALQTARALVTPSGNFENAQRDSMPRMQRDANPPERGGFTSTDHGRNDTSRKPLLRPSLTCRNLRPRLVRCS